MPSIVPDWHNRDLQRESEGATIVRQRVTLGSDLHADEGTHWDKLEADYIVHRINQGEAFSWDGARTNQAECYFSRLRRAVDGQHHHVSKQHLYQYANEAAWREDHRRTDNKGLHTLALASALHSPASRAWKGYWQRAA